MALFPALKTGAVAQYPGTIAQHFKTETVQFLDGSEQRFRCAPSVLHRWEINLNKLDEQETATIEEFFTLNSGDYAVFAFVDPWTGTTYPNCSIEGDRLDLTYGGPLSGSVRVVIRENRQ